jgi:hypothetical protein
MEEFNRIFTRPGPGIEEVPDWRAYAFRDSSIPQGRTKENGT